MDTSEMVYPEKQEEFIQDFSKLLKYRENESLLVYNTHYVPLQDTIVIVEPRHNRKEGRTTSFCELIRRLFVLSRESPVEFALAYTRVDKKGTIERFMLLEALLEQADIKGLIRACLFDLLISESIKKHHYSYLVCSPLEELQVHLTLLKSAGPCVTSFFSVYSTLEQYGINMSKNDTNIVIISSNCRLSGMVDELIKKRIISTRQWRKVYYRKNRELVK